MGRDSFSVNHVPSLELSCLTGTPQANEIARNRPLAKRVAHDLLLIFKVAAHNQKLTVTLNLNSRKSGLWKACGKNPSNQLILNNFPWMAGPRI
jgi:hypothetical protein